MDISNKDQTAFSGTPQIDIRTSYYYLSCLYNIHVHVHMTYHDLHTGMDSEVGALIAKGNVVGD